MNVTFLEKVISKFTKTAQSQEEKGIKKYGHEVQPMDVKHDWLNMAEEELIDGYKYLVAERERRDKILSDAIDLLNGLQATRRNDPGVHYTVNLVKLKLAEISKNLIQ